MKAYSLLFLLVGSVSAAELQDFQIADNITATTIVDADKGDISIASDVWTVDSGAVDHSELANNPTIPTTTSELTNDSGFITSQTDDQDAGEVPVDTATFNNNLTGVDTTVQIALNSIDNLNLLGGIYAGDGTLGSGTTNVTSFNTGAFDIDYSDSANAFRVSDQVGDVELTGRGFAVLTVGSSVNLARGGSALNVGGNGTIMTFAAGDDLTINSDTGTSGQVFTSNGSNNPPTWTAKTTDTDTNLYNIDGTLGASRTIDISGNTIFFKDGLNDVLTLTPTEQTLDGGSGGQVVANVAQVELKFGAAGLRIDTDFGLSGEVLSSNGSTSAPTWEAVGDVTKVGTPVNNQVGVWTGDGTLEGDVDLVFDGTQLAIGISAPLERLHVHNSAGGSAGAAALFNSGTTGATATDGLYVGYSNKAYIWNYENTGISFATNSSIRMTVDPAGSLTLKPLATAPPGTLGSWYTDTSAALCWHDGTAWVVVKGSGTCL